MNRDLMSAEIISLVAVYGVRIVGVLIALWISLKGSSFLARKLSTALLARKFDETLSLFFGNIVRWSILVAAVLACLSIFGIETTSFAAIIGAAGLAIGLAFQGTLSNFASGVMLLVFRPFKVGDYVVAGGKEGSVAEIGLFVTLLDTLDNRRICLANTAIVGGVIENNTAHPMRRVDIDVKIDRHEDIDATRAALEAAGKEVASQEGMRAEVFLHALGLGNVEWQVRVWTPSAEYWNVWQATVRAVGYQLAKSKISLAAPVMSVAVSGATPSGWQLQQTGTRPVVR